jgi:hypothetical protein
MGLREFGKAGVADEGTGITAYALKGPVISVHRQQEGAT